MPTQRKLSDFYFVPKATVRRPEQVPVQTRSIDPLDLPCLERPAVKRKEPLPVANRPFKSIRCSPSESSFGEEEDDLPVHVTKKQKKTSNEHTVRAKTGFADIYRTLSYVPKSGEYVALPLKGTGPRVSYSAIARPLCELNLDNIPSTWYCKLPPSTAKPETRPDSTKLIKWGDWMTIEEKDWKASTLQ